MSESELLAKQFHDTYERLAPAFGYKTREASAKPWDAVPSQNKGLMIAVASELISQDNGWCRMEGYRRILKLYAEACHIAGVTLLQEDSQTLAEVLSEKFAPVVDFGPKEKREEMITYLMRAGEKLQELSAGFFEGAAVLFGQRGELGELARALFQVARVIKDPERTISALVKDRDDWQRLAKSQQEELQLTEYGLGKSQESVVSLAEGQSTMIELLEIVARAEWSEIEKIVPRVREVLAGVSVVDRP
jgi:hypothetical protein